MLLRIIEECDQSFPVTHERCTRLGVGLLEAQHELIALLLTCRAARGVHHGAQVFARGRLIFLSQCIEHVDDLVIPTPLLITPGMDLTERRPNSQMTSCWCRFVRSISARDTLMDDRACMLSSPSKACAWVPSAWVD